VTGSAANGLAPNGKQIESVWDYPRPPRVERVEWRVRVVHAGGTVVDAPHALRVLETSHPPSYYVAAEFVDLDVLVPSSRRSLCEWKGVAEYADLVIADAVVRDVAWTYPSPTPRFGDLVDHWAFYAQKLDQCFIDDEQVTSSEGSFYGGWATVNVTGPFKGAPGTSHW
jgi:uncharacterized protein (DUF427 family)